MTTQTETGYQGWKNYETWHTKLVMDNDEASYNHWRAATADLYSEAVEGSIFTKVERARLDLMDALKEDHEAALPDLSDNPFAAALLQAGFDEIDWHEIADSLLREFAENALYALIGW